MRWQLDANALALLNKTSREESELCENGSALVTYKSVWIHQRDLGALGSLVCLTRGTRPCTRGFRRFRRLKYVHILSNPKDFQKKQLYQRLHRMPLEVRQNIVTRSKSLETQRIISFIGIVLSVSYKTGLVSIVINFRHRLGRTQNSIPARIQASHGHRIQRPRNKRHIQEGTPAKRHYSHPNKVGLDIQIWRTRTSFKIQSPNSRTWRFATHEQRRGVRFHIGVKDIPDIVGCNMQLRLVGCS